MHVGETMTRRTEVLLSVNRALWGKVSPQLREVKVKDDTGTVLIKVYFDGPISRADRDAMAEVGTEVVADLPEDNTVRLEYVRLDAPRPIPAEGDTVYARREGA